MKVSGLGWFGFILFIVPALKVYAIQRIGFLDTLFDIWGIISCLSLVLITVKIKKNVLIKYIISFVLIYLVSTWFHNPDQLIGAISETSRLLIVPFYMLLIKHEHSMVSFLVKLRKSFILLLFVDTFTGTVQIAGIRIFENNAITFLGLDNYAAFIIIPMLSIIFFTSYICVGRIRRIDIMIYFLSFTMKLLTNSLSALLALIIFGLTIFLGLHWEKIREQITPRKIMILIIILLIMIVGFGIQNFFEPLFTKLGRDVTLSYRTVIWDKLLRSIPESLLIGYGKTSGDEFKTIVGLSLLYDTQANHPHSFYLAVLFSTGCIGCIVFFRMLFLTFKGSFQNRKSKSMYLLSCGLISFFIIAFADDYIMLPYLYILICIVNYYAFFMLHKNLCTQ